MTGISAVQMPLNEDTAAADSGTASAVVTAFTFEQDNAKLKVTVDTNSSGLIIREARYTSPDEPSVTRVLEKLCDLIVGRPLQEAADHGVIYVMSVLPGDCVAVDGIRLPRNAGPAFALAEQLIRGVHATALSSLGMQRRESGWYVRPGSAWLAKDEAAKADVLKPIIADFLHARNLAEDEIWISRIERGSRVTIAFGDGISYAAKPELTLALERRLRREAGTPLELFMEEMKDANKIRRL